MSGFRNNIIPKFEKNLMNIPSLIRNRQEFLAIILVCGICLGIGFTFSYLPPWFWLGLDAVILLCFLLTRKAEGLFLFWILASPLLREYLNISGGGIPNITLDRIVLLSLVAWLMLVNTIHIKGESGLKFKDSVSPTLLLFLFLAFELLSYWGGAWRLRTSLQYYLDRVLLPAATFVLAFWFVKTKGEIFAWKIIAVLVWVGIYSMVLEILRRYAGIESLLYPNGRVFIWDDVVGTRAVGEFYNPTIFGGMIIYSIIGIYYGALPKILAKGKGIIVLSMVWAILFTFTRTVWLSFVIIAIIIFFFGPLKLQNKRFIFILLLLMAGGLILGFPIIQTEISKRILNLSNIVFRQDYVLDSIKMFLAKPIIGWGAGGFDSLHYVKAYDYTTHSYYFTGNPSHNSFLLLLVDGGLVAFIPYITFIGYVLIKSISAYKYGTGEIKKMIFLIWTGVINYLVIANSIQVEYFPYFICVFWLMLGILSGLQSSQNRLIIKSESSA